MSALSLEDVRKVSRLARLSLTPAEEQRFTTQLGQILSYMDILAEVETAASARAASASGNENIFRDDVVQPSLPRTEALANAPKQDGKYFLVPQIIEGA
jgi:aspartyl-tRNA(Asn)/glutamyl-tRNA(Gln) amidotransferase subunit C